LLADILELKMVRNTGSLEYNAEVSKRVLNAEAGALQQDGKAARDNAHLFEATDMASDAPVASSGKPAAVAKNSTAHTAHNFDLIMEDANGASGAAFTVDVAVDEAPIESLETPIQFGRSITNLARNFKVCVNPAVAVPHEFKALQLEFAGWFPGSVLLLPGTQVELMPNVNKEYRKSLGTAKEHRAEDPRIVKVQIPKTHDREEETLQVSHSILRYPALKEEQASSRQHRIKELLTEFPAAGSQCELFTVIGCNEFVCGGKAEREYWLCLATGACRPLAWGAESTRCGLCHGPAFRSWQRC